MTELLIVPRHSLARVPEELGPLVEEIKDNHDLSVEVRPPPPHRGYAVTWYKVLVIYLLNKGLDAVVGHAFELLIDDIKERVKSRYRDRRAKKGDNRPFSLTFRDARGELLRSFELQPNGEIEDVTKAEESPQPPPAPEDYATPPPEEPEYDVDRLTNPPTKRAVYRYLLRYRKL